MAYHVHPDLPLAVLVDALLESVGPAEKVFAVRPPAYPRGMAGDAAGITSTDIATAVNELMAARGKMPIASDMGDCLFTAMEIEHMAPAAPGRQAATGQRPLILVGDGAFQMTGRELGNRRRCGWDPIGLLFNNANWEMRRTFQPEPG